MEEGDDCFIPPAETKKRKVSKNTELKRLENHLPDAMERRRTRSDAGITNTDFLTSILTPNPRHNKESEGAPKQSPLCLQLRNGASPKLHEKCFKFST